ncbi:hypothetical protein L1889_08150 [Paenalcaligenes niemegkensis]|uniref:hypothetical protein n=1 Tax=Paenalcaligenes niemegkensis TaxID=2895469 RepID=UPI001EE85F08|nr:hypothetical protein [Paenalcaligenes niemegkensis]MCQ9616685.1 hypothetical protein [Paenalcaligenes niemegkensis]
MLLALLVVVIGGLGSVKSVVLSALILGFVETFSRVWFPSFSSAVTLGVMLLILVVRPNGLLQARTRFA